jgi:hypothetical protein
MIVFRRTRRILMPRNRKGRSRAGMLPALFVPLLLLPRSEARGQGWFHTGQRADLLLSGVDFNNSGGPLRFNHPSGLASDGTRLLLCDRFNNRVLIWHAAPDRWDAPPDLVLGQPDFFANDPGEGRNGLNWPGNVSVAANGVVTVADTENDRILVWTAFPARNAQPADRVLSLPAMTPQGTAQRWEWPWGAWTDGARLAAVATHGQALLFWNSLPARDDQPPDYTIALPQFGTIRNISTDGATWFFVGDHNAKVNGDRPGTFFWNSFPARADQPWDFFREEWIKGAALPNGGLAAGGLGAVYVWNRIPVSAAQAPDLVVQNTWYRNGDGPDAALAAGRWYINNYNGNNVHVYRSPPARGDQPPDYALGSSAVTVNTLDSINYLQNPVLATDGASLVATSDFDRALWIWTTIPTRSGAAPDLRLPLRTWDLAPWDNALHHGRLVLAGRRAVAVWDSLPLRGETPSLLLRNRIGDVVFQNLRGVALDSVFFALADENGTLALWRGVPATENDTAFLKITSLPAPLNHLHSDGRYLCVATQGAPAAVFVFRHADLLAGNTVPWKVISRSPQLPLNLPAGALPFDGGLAVANTSGNAVYLWRDIAQAGDPSAAIVLGQRSLAGMDAAIGSDRLFMPASLAAHGGALWVGELKFSSRILRFRSDSAATGVIARNEAPGFALETPAPNPFTSDFTIRFSLFAPARIRLAVVDALGREEAVLADGAMNAGFHTRVYRAAQPRPGLRCIVLSDGRRVLVRRALCLAP